MKNFVQNFVILICILFFPFLLLFLSKEKEDEQKIQDKEGNKMSKAFSMSEKRPEDMTSEELIAWSQKNQEETAIFMKDWDAENKKRIGEMNAAQVKIDGHLDRLEAAQREKMVRRAQKQKGRFEYHPPGSQPPARDPFAGTPHFVAVEIPTERTPAPPPQFTPAVPPTAVTRVTVETGPKPKTK